MIFHNFPNAIFCTETRHGRTKNRIAPEFEGSAAPPPERVTVTLELDADILEWLKAQPLGWEREINNAARFVMDMSNAPFPPPEAYEDDLTCPPEPGVGGHGRPGPGPQRRPHRARFRSLIFEAYIAGEGRQEVIDGRVDMSTCWTHDQSTELTGQKRHAWKPADRRFQSFSCQSRRSKSRGGAARD